MSVKTISSEYISRHQYFTARKDSYQTETGKIVDPYFVVELPMAAAVMAITEDKDVVMVKQYRHPVGCDPNWECIRFDHTCHGWWGKRKRTGRTGDNLWDEPCGPSRRFHFVRCLSICYRCFRTGLFRNFLHRRG